MVNNKHRTSLKDLAKELGVSIATVSRALRNSPEIGLEMQTKVKELAKRLNYRPNPFAQSLRKEAPRVIGVVVPNLVTHYYAAVLDGIEDEARKAGYSVIGANTHEQSEKEVKAIDNFISLHVEGIIACLSQNTTDYSHFEEISQMGIPLVFFGRTCLPEKFSCVTANGDEAAQEATQHLIDTGSRRIAFIGGPNHLDMVKRRKHGSLEALRENKIPIDPTTDRMAKEFQIVPSVAALSGGEDYELLFTIDQKDYEKIQTMSTDVTVIGYMTDDKGVAEMITPDNHVIPIKAQGWDHMRK